MPRRVVPLQFGTIGRPSSIAGNSFKSTPGYTYFTPDEEFEAIPLMCFLATCAPTRQKAVLFLDISGCETQYRTLIERITGWRVFVPTSTGNHHSNEAAASSFVKFRESAILLLHFKILSLPSALNNVPLDSCVYWGSSLAGFVPLLQAKKHRASLECQSTSLIMTTTQANKLSRNLARSDFIMHPSSADLHHRKDSPWLSDLRAATRSVLSGDSKLVKGLYEAHLNSLVMGSLGAEEIAIRINKFTARVLLTGEAEDGSKKYPPIASRLVTPLSVVNGFNLQAAVDAGLLYIW
ncbi:hypothetical protein RSAG8_08215, partial [Rhizoctonia solani AG-8 WAC10335]